MRACGKRVFCPIAAAVCRLAALASAASLSHSAHLRPRLDDLYSAFDLEHVVADPIWIVRRFRHPADREIVAFCASALAFGRVQSVLNSIEALVAVMGERPAEFVRRFEPEVHGAALFPLVHRWTRGVDLVALLWLLRQMIERGGSLEGFFAEGIAADAETVEAALESFSTRALALDLTEAYGTAAGEARRRLFLLAALVRRRLQAAQPVPALDGAHRPRGSGALVPCQAGSAHRAPRHSRD